MSLRLDPIGRLEAAWYRFRPQRDIAAALIDRLRDLPPSARVLDFGAGTGHVADALSQALPCQIVRADVALPATSADTEDAWVLLPERGHLPLEGDAFDAIFMVDVLHHVPSPIDTLTELRRALRPTGRLIIVDYNRRRAPVRGLNLVCRVMRGRWSLFTAEEICDLCRQTGLAPIPTELDSLRVLVESTVPGL